MSISTKGINQKLESVLKRNLANDEYQNIRCYERCIVDKAVRLVLLTPKHLVITDNPPKNILYCYSLVDCVSVLLLQTIPEFLKDGESIPCQHIEVELLSDSSTSFVLKKSGSQSSFLGSSDDSSPNSSLSKSQTTSGLSVKHGNLKGALSKSLDEASARSIQKIQLPSVQRETTKVSLFPLTDSSFFYTLLNSTVLNCQIHYTLTSGFTPQSTKPRKHKHSATEVQLYQQLSTEFQGQTSLESLFLLTKELYTATRTRPHVKAFFWKDEGLVNKILRRLKSYLQTTSKDNNRADELELSIELLSCLTVMMRESEHLPQRVQILSCNRNENFKLLVECCTTYPVIPDRLAGSIEVDSLVGEVFDNMGSLLFEIFLLTTKHPRFEAQLTPVLLCQLLESKLQSSKKVIGSIVERTLSEITRSVSPKLTVKIFQTFFILEAVSRNSGTIWEFITDRFTEDIRYYCSSPESRITRYCPLQKITIEKIKYVLSELSRTSPYRTKP